MHSADRKINFTNGVGPRGRGWRRRTRWLLQPKDFVAMQLSGAAAPDPWSSKGICRVGDGAPAPEVLAVCGWPEQACPPIAAAWSPRGTVTAAAARRGDVEGVAAWARTALERISTA